MQTSGFLNLGNRKDLAFCVCQFSVIKKSILKKLKYLPGKDRALSFSDGVLLEFLEIRIRTKGEEMF